jgi:hypothetical protein
MAVAARKEEKNVQHCRSFTAQTACSPWTRKAKSTMDRMSFILTFWVMRLVNTDTSTGLLILTLPGYQFCAFIIMLDEITVPAVALYPKAAICYRSSRAVHEQQQQKV